MGNSRTLLRKLKRAASPLRTRVGTPRRRVTDISHTPAPAFYQWSLRDDPETFAELGLEADFHATKGLRVRKAV